jgi:hypothetical protein
MVDLWDAHVFVSCRAMWNYCCIYKDRTGPVLSFRHRPLKDGMGGWYMESRDGKLVGLLVDTITRRLREAGITAVGPWLALYTMIFYIAFRSIEPMQPRLFSCHKATATLRPERQWKRQTNGVRGLQESRIDLHQPI